MRKNRGFTLVELITVLLITGIISMMVVNMITTPMEAYSDMKRRAELVDIAEITLQRMARDIHHALPNSVKIEKKDSVETIAFLHTITGARYRSSNCKSFNTTDIPPVTTFYSIKEVANKTNITFALGNELCAVTEGVEKPADCLVIYNLGYYGVEVPCDDSKRLADAYCGNNIKRVTNIPVPEDCCDDESKQCHSIEFNSVSNFPLSSPEDRFMIVDKAIAFICDTNKNQIKLYSGYDFTESTGEPVPMNSDKGTLLADNISACNFKYDPGSSTRPGLVTLQISVNDPLYVSEKITLLHQIFVENQP